MLDNHGSLSSDTSSEEKTENESEININANEGLKTFLNTPALQNVAEQIILGIKMAFEEKNKKE